MQRIRTLSDQVARQIAAGEVVERPASVVKELVENSIDAGARSITVRIEDGGVRMIEVCDDGCGMSREDLVLAPRNFSTSKIETVEDLAVITTYGFRGEALASITSVSRTSITSSDKEDGEGWSISVVGEDFSSPSPCPRERGTTVTVRDLFFNTPARKKFLRSRTSEKRKILDTILAFAVIRPGLEIHYIDDGRRILDLVPCDSWEERVEMVLGSTTMKHMVAVNRGDSGMRIRGFVSLPTFTRGSRNHQFIYVNKRLVREKTTIHAINEAYRNVIPPRRHPVLILDMDVPPEEVDVNVHPGKLEVRVRDEGRVHAMVRRCIKDALSPSSEQRMEVHYVPRSEGAGVDRDSAGSEEIPVNPAVSLFDGEVVRERRGEDEKVISLQERIRRACNRYMERAPKVDLSSQLSLRPEESREPSQPDEEMPLGTLAEEGLFWQLHRTYIFIQVRGGLVVIDQHAAHERIIYDTSRKGMDAAGHGAQQLLFPVHLELSLSELEVFHSNRDTFEKLGFAAEPFGGKSILVKSHPQGLKNWEEGKLFLQILDDIVQNRAPGESALERILASFACRSAVRAGQSLTTQEMKMLADQLFAVENPYSCPHGRPTIQRISLAQIERWFLR